MLQQSSLQKSVLNILEGLACTWLSNLSLLTSPLSIAKLHTEVVHGLFVEPKLSGRPFLCMDDGMSEVLTNYVLISSLSRFSVLPALSLHNGIIHCYKSYL